MTKMPVFLVLEEIIPSSSQFHTYMAPNHRSNLLFLDFCGMDPILLSLSQRKYMAWSFLVSLSREDYPQNSVSAHHLSKVTAQPLP